MLNLNKIFLLIILSSPLSTYAQEADSIQLKPISTEAMSNESKQRLIRMFSTRIQLMAFKGDPRRIELAEYTDTVLVTTDTACVVLKNGGRWNPLKAPSTKGFIWKTIFSKNQDSVYNNTWKYLQFSSNGPYTLIDSLSFINSYHNQDGELLIRVEFVNKPTTQKETMALTSRRVIYLKDE